MVQLMDETGAKCGPPFELEQVFPVRVFEPNEPPFADIRLIDMDC